MYIEPCSLVDLFAKPKCTNNNKMAGLIPLKKNNYSRYFPAQLPVVYLGSSLLLTRNLEYGNYYNHNEVAATDQMTHLTFLSDYHTTPTKLRSVVLRDFFQCLMLPYFTYRKNSVNAENRETRRVKKDEGNDSFSR